MTPVYYTILMRDRSYFVDGYAVADLRGAMLAGRDTVELTLQPNAGGCAPQTICVQTDLVVAVIRHDGLLERRRAAPVAEVIPIDRYRAAEAL